MTARLSLPPLLKYSLVGLAAGAIALGLAFWGNRGSQVRLDVEEIKARIVGTDENSAVLILELRLGNPARVPFVVREVRISAAVPGRGDIPGVLVSEIDLDRVLDYYRHVGQRYNPTLKIRERFGGGARVDRTLAASFALSEQMLARRGGVLVELIDVDGAVVTARLK